MIGMSIDEMIIKHYTEDTSYKIDKETLKIINKCGVDAKTATERMLLVGKLMKESR